MIVTPLSCLVKCDYNYSPTRMSSYPKNILIPPPILQNKLEYGGRLVLNIPRQNGHHDKKLKELFYPHQHSMSNEFFK